jgi:phage tail tape-measure protein
VTSANGPAAAAGDASRAGTKRPYSDIDSSNPPPAAFTAGFAAAVAAEAGAGPAGLGQQQQQQGGLQVTIFFDGGSRNNPGNAGYGYVIYDRATNQRVGVDREKCVRRELLILSSC